MMIATPRQNLEAVLIHEIFEEFGARPDLRIWRNNTGAARRGAQYVRFGLPGAADILGLLRGGRFLAIEAKSPTGKQSPDQINFQSLVESLGGLYILARHVDDVRAAIEERR